MTNHFTQAVNMVGEWRKPTASEAAQGFVAMLPRIYYCLTDRGMLVIGYSGGYTDKDTKVVYPKRQVWEGYTQERLERREKYGTGDLPAWFTPQENLEQEWLDYLAGNEPSAGVKSKLKTLGSYEKMQAA